MIIHHSVVSQLEIINIIFPLVALKEVSLSVTIKIIIHSTIWVVIDLTKKHLQQINVDQKEIRSHINHYLLG